jgi:DNA mismatch endonuclease, patch repair protein
MDSVTPAQRSRIMSHIRSKNTTPEIMLRKFLFKKGFRYRVHTKSLPGKPDIVLPKYKTVIFVNGCFWHQHDGCKSSKIPKSKQDYWEAKLAHNRERDALNIANLTSLGWRVLTVWECELSKKNCSRFEEIASILVEEEFITRKTTKV